MFDSIIADNIDPNASCQAFNLCDAQKSEQKKFEWIKETIKSDKSSNINYRNEKKKFEKIVNISIY